jgi:hypothetical protein
MIQPMRLGVTSFKPTTPIIHELINKTCITQANYKSTFMKADPYHQWYGKYPLDMDKFQFEAFRCQGELPPGLARVMPKYTGFPDVLIYNRCIHTLYTSMRRMMIRMPQPDLRLAERFECFYRRKVVQLVEDYGYTVQYGYSAWWNHLTAFQQSRIKKIDPSSDLDDLVITLMTKVELQIIDNPNDWPKARAISMPSEEHKLSTGPLAYALEYFCKKYLNGFASGLSFQDKEQLLNQAESMGYVMRVADDCKGWDLGVKKENDSFCFFITTLIDHCIVKLTDEDVVFKQLCSRWHKVKAELRTKDGFISLGYILLLDQMFSGTTVTLLRNTFNNIMLKQFVVEDLLGVSDYMLACSGDDSEVNLPLMDKTLVTNAFLAIGTLDVNQDGGLGIVYKYLNITGIEGYNFCQTEAFRCNVCGWKIIRILKNVLVKMMYSSKVLSLSNQAKEVYMTALYDAGMLWGAGLPIIHEHLQHFNFENRSYDLIMNGLRRETVEVEDELLYLTNHEPPIYQMLAAIDKDFYYANRGRVSVKKACCVSAYVDMLQERYGIYANDLQQICYDILHPIDDEIDSPLLVEALKYRESYQFE